VSEPRTTRPSAEPEPQRYTGRPLLVLLENYVLDTVGELDRHAQSRVAAAVRQAFGGGKDWRATFRRQLGLDDGLDLELAELWEERRDQARAEGHPLHPVQFAKMVADEFFSDLL
jgi:hypothetical protein